MNNFESFILTLAVSVSIFLMQHNWRNRKKRYTYFVTYLADRKFGNAELFRDKKMERFDDMLDMQDFLSAKFNTTVVLLSATKIKNSKQNSHANRKPR